METGSAVMSSSEKVVNDSKNYLALRRLLEISETVKEADGYISQYSGFTDPRDKLSLAERLFPEVKTYCFCGEPDDNAKYKTFLVAVVKRI